MIYVAIFIITTFLFYLSEKYFRNKNRGAGNTIAILGLVGISVFAALRDIKVGTDVSYYLVSQFNNADHFDNYIDYLAYMSESWEAEPVYSALLYFSHRLSDNIHLILFMLAIITYAFFYLGLKEKRNEISVPFGWMMYCLLYFNTSLNLLRQSCAISIIWYITVLFSDKKITRIKCIILLLLAAGFHRTAILVGPALLVLMWCFQTGKKLLTLLFSCVMCIFPFMFRFFSSIILGLSFLPGKYRVFFDRMNSGQSSVLLDAIVYLVPLLAFWYLFKKKRSERRNLLFYLVLGVSSISCAIASNLLVNRISYYFTVFFSYSIPYTTRIISVRDKSRMIYMIGITIWFLFMWIINIVVFNYGQTYPYILGI